MTDHYQIIRRKIIAAIFLIVVIRVTYLWTRRPARNSKSNNNLLEEINTRVDQQEPWKTYKNIRYGYAVNYPPRFEVTGVSQENLVDTTSNAIFDYPNPYFGLPVFSVIVVEPVVDPYKNPHYVDLQKAFPKIFSLGIGEELDQKTTQQVGGGWEYPTRYKRLPDEVIDGQEFVVIENPEWYGGSNRILLTRRNGNVYLIEKTYQKIEELEEFQQFYSSFRFTQ